MLALDSPYWSDLQHAYGAATDIPGLLSQLMQFPEEAELGAEPWSSLWSCLFHQDEVYPASFAAVPHIIAALKSAPQRATMSFFLLSATIEVARREQPVALASNLESAYFASLAEMPSLVSAAAQPEWHPDVCASAMAALAASTGNHQLAQLIMEVEGPEIPEVLAWLESR